MGTNYYVQDETCEHCGRGGDQLHIGKSSGGWVFALATHSDPEIKSFSDWLSYLQGKRIVDEYGTVLSLEIMLVKITGRAVLGQTEEKSTSGGSYDESCGLFRQDRAIFHGVGTWSMMPEGDFS